MDLLFSVSHPGYGPTFSRSLFVAQSLSSSNLDRTVLNSMLTLLHLFTVGRCCLNLFRRKSKQSPKVVPSKPKS